MTRLGSGGSLAQSAGEFASDLPGRAADPSASWLNLAEIWFGIIERQAIHRGTFRSVTDLTTKIRNFINGWNDRPPVHLDKDCRRNPR